MPGLATPDAEELTKGMHMLETNIDRWEAQAIARGVQRGETFLLQRQLTVVLANCPPPSRPNLPPPRPPSWKSGGDRVLDASSLDEVLATPITKSG